MKALSGSGGSTEDPAQTVRRHERSVAVQPGWAVSACRVAGTCSVRLGRSSAMARSVAVGSKRLCSSTVAPTESAGRVWMHRPPTWNSGSTVSTVSSAVRPCTCAAMAMFASRLPWVCTAALGAPVVPEV